VNENVTGATLILQLVSTKIITEDESLRSFLITLDDSTILELHDHLGIQINDIHLTVKHRTLISPSLKLIIKSLTGQTYEIYSSATETICMLKCRIQFQKNIPLSLQRFIFQGKELKDEATLAEYSINDNSTFHLVLKLRGGKLVIRLRSTSDQSISNVNVHLHNNHA
ncbi:unnamed protein product, partial [Rotaria sp. Silwood2]